jgi:lysozyme family protein
MINNFTYALKETLSHEGKYSNDPNDAGGETYLGISRIYHPYWKGWEIIDETKEIFSPNTKEFIKELFTRDIYLKIEEFYKDKFWEPLHLSLINSKNISTKLFDMGVNLGIPRTAALVQTSLNVMNYGLDYELKVDNMVGRITVNVINEMTKEEEGEQFLLRLLSIQQGALYIKLAQNNPIQRKFIKGWINRLNIDIH